MATHLVKTASEANLELVQSTLRLYGQFNRVGNLSDPVIRGCLMAKVDGAFALSACAKW
jgi:hypothetical protein